MIEKTFANDELEIELTSHINNKQNICFKVARLDFFGRIPPTFEH